jgi:hypothetical protein
VAQQGVGAKQFGGAAHCGAAPKTEDQNRERKTEKMEIGNCAKNGPAKKTEKAFFLTGLEAPPKKNGTAYKSRDYKHSAAQRIIHQY